MTSSSFPDEVAKISETGLPLERSAYAAAGVLPPTTEEVSASLLSATIVLTVRMEEALFERLSDLGCGYVSIPELPKAKE